MVSTLIENLIPVIVAIGLPAILMMANKGLQLLGKRIGLEEMHEYEDLLDRLVTKGVRAAEQRAINAVKAGGEKTSGQQKLEEAIKFVNSQLKDLGLKERASEELVDLIESKLFEGALEKNAA